MTFSTAKIMFIKRIQKKILAPSLIVKEKNTEYLKENSLLQQHLKQHQYSDLATRDSISLKGPYNPKLY